MKVAHTEYGNGAESCGITCKAAPGGKERDTSMDRVEDGASSGCICAYLVRTHGELKQGCQSEDLKRRKIGVWYKDLYFFCKHT